MTANSTKRKASVSFFGVLTDLLIDLALMGLGFALYYNFMVSPYLPFTTINPVFTGLVGGFDNAVYIMSGVPFVVGVFSLFRTFGRVIKSFSGH